MSTMMSDGGQGREGGRRRGKEGRDRDRGEYMKWLGGWSHTYIHSTTRRQQEHIHMKFDNLPSPPPPLTHTHTHTHTTHSPAGLWSSKPGMTWFFEASFFFSAVVQTS